MGSGLARVLRTAWREVDFELWSYRKTVGRVVSALREGFPAKGPTGLVEVQVLHDDPAPDPGAYVRLIVYALERSRAPCLELRLPTGCAELVLAAIQRAYPEVRVVPTSRPTERSRFLLWLVPA